MAIRLAPQDRRFTVYNKHNRHREIVLGVEALASYINIPVDQITPICIGRCTYGDFVVIEDKSPYIRIYPMVKMINHRYL